MEYIVTSHEHLTLDEFASIYAYSDFINKLGFKSIYYISKNIDAKILNICNKFNIHILDNIDFDDNANVILVAESDISRTVYKINPKNVTEIIDKKYTFGLEAIFDNANICVNIGSSISTIIAKRIIEHNIQVSNESLILLYSAIIDCTKNLKLPTTTKDDIEVVAWLKSKIKI